MCPSPKCKCLPVDDREDTSHYSDHINAKKNAAVVDITYRYRKCETIPLFSDITVTYNNKLKPFSEIETLKPIVAPKWLVKKMKVS